MKQCTSCNAYSEDDAKFCGSCGAPFPGTESAAPAQYGGAPRAATKKEFLLLPDNVQMKKQLRSSAIICYVCAALSLALAFITDNMISLVDVVIVAALGLGIHFRQSRACAVALLAYAALGAILSLVSSGKMSGYLVVLAGIYAISATFKLEKEWKQYRGDGV